jgi:hypothetical protein
MIPPWSVLHTVMLNRRFLHIKQSIRIFPFTVVHIFNRRYQTGNFNLKFHFLVDTLLDRLLRFALIASPILLWGRQLRFKFLFCALFQSSPIFTFTIPNTGQSIGIFYAFVSKFIDTFISPSTLTSFRPIVIFEVNSTVFFLLHRCRYLSWPTVLIFEFLFCDIVADWHHAMPGSTVTKGTRGSPVIPLATPREESPFELCLLLPDLFLQYKL